jgi:hypothetical protein
MKTTILMLMLATAGFAEVAAKVPFPFEAAGVKLPGGAYALREVSGTNGVSWVLRNQATMQSVMVIRLAQGDARKEGQGAIRFRCTDAGRCALTEFWRPGEPRNVLNTPQWVKEQGSDRLVALGR